MEAVLWMFLPVLVAGGSSLLSYYMMQARMEVALAKERESLAEARATINSQKVTMEERIRATEEATKRTAMDELMQDFRVEERSYMRENKSLSSSRKSMIMQERLFFRNIPLSNWIEREMLVEEGHDLDQIAARESVFVTEQIAPAEGRLAISKFLDDVSLDHMDSRGDLPAVPPVPRPILVKDEPVRRATLVPAAVAAFGAQ